ncbi:hypothetical protein WN944_013041 [Citrus x changshan-huyou]|uniref:Uncharacterized protein n=1 Tax=Citrus x changshan-huyou TaxID=2935761 RepID=A0AAP0M361_9ROSI
MAGDGDKTLVLWVEHALSNEKLRGCWCGGDLAVRWLLGRLKAWRDDQSTSAQLIGSGRHIHSALEQPVAIIFL